jgi:hypothetical protein
MAQRWSQDVCRQLGNHISAPLAASLRSNADASLRSNAGA